MDLVTAVKFAAEFLEYFDNIIVTMIPKTSLDMKPEVRIKEIDKIMRALLTGHQWLLEKCNRDWVQLIQIAVKHYEPEVT
jgi:hypothetical protein